MFWGINKKNHKGFSFTEMSVVIASVTAVVIMALSGYVIVKKTKSNNVLAHISYFHKAIIQFEEKHGGLPGDIAMITAFDIADGTTGNGNGTIDTPSEAINVWYHLSAAELIDGHFDGISGNTLGVGIPMADIEGGGYKVRLASSVNTVEIPDQSVLIELSGFNGTYNDLPILTTEEAKAIDEKADDGNPLKGKIIAEGMNTECVTAEGRYNLSHNSKACRLLFILRSETKKVETPRITGECNQLGQTRQSSDSNDECPIGYEGIVVETCRVSSDNVGTWEITDKNCAEVKCSGGKSYGDTRKLSCINGMSGTEGIVEQCTENGIWKVIRTDCYREDNHPCETNGDTRKEQACDWGESGHMLQTCTNNKWDVPSSGPNNTCSAIKCGADNIGDTKRTNSCGINYTGTVAEICTVSGGWVKTSLASTCAPIFGSCNTGSDSTKDLGCPPGKKGEHIVKCIENDSNDYWTTLRNSCEPIKCSGKENIGAVRAKEGASCPKGRNGKVMEYCDENGKWQEILTNCVIGVCERPDDNKGHAYWPSSIAGTTNVRATSCTEGYEATSGTPTRSCNSDETWGNTVTNPCTRKTCPELHANSSFPEVYAGESDVSAISCIAGYFAPIGYPKADCSMESTWENTVEECVDFRTFFEPIVWYDASDQDSVYENDSCTDKAEINDTVGCLADKSGFNRHATQSDINRRPLYKAGDSD